MYRLLFLSLFFLASLFGLAKGVSMWFDSADASSQSTLLIASASAPKTMETNGDETTLRRDGSGRFFLTAEANGRDARFLVDTGADIVALSPEEAEDLDVQFDRNSFKPITRTASGVAMGQRVTIDQLMIADHEFRNVDALVVEGLETNLLGQSLIRELGTIEMRDDAMIIHHKV